MGNKSHTSTSAHSKDEKQFHSFEEHLKGLMSLNLDKKEKMQMRHRFSETNLSQKNNPRNSYFTKLSQGNKKEKAERDLVRSQNSLRHRVSIMGVKQNEREDNIFDDKSSLSGSYLEKPLSMSMVEESVDRSEINIYDTPKRGKLSSIKNASSRGSSKENNKENKVRENIKTNSKSKAGNKLNKLKSRCLRKSLSFSQTNDELSSYSITKNTLFLKNEVENEFVDSSKNTSLIDIKNKRRKQYLSSGDISINNTPLGEEFSELALNNPDQSITDNVSVISNLYSVKSRPQNNDYELKYVKDGEYLRNSYIAKLIYKQVWTPSKKEKDHNTLIIFDWDDTLLCTSFLTPNGVFHEDLQLNDKEQEKVAKLEFSSLRILTAAIEKGDTFIITNAAPGWVEYSAERFYPSVKKLLSKVKIISARGEYESLYPGDSRMWKIQAFLNMQKYFDNNLVTNIICLGDSFIEMEAGHVLASKFSQAFIKTIKFRESPKPEELNKQLSLVADQFNAVYSAVKNLTIRVEKKFKK